MSALHRVLVDFGRDQQTPPFPLLVSPPAVPDPDLDLGFDPEPQPDAESAADRVADRVAEAVADALAAAEASHAQAVHDLAERHVADLAEARALWVAEEGTVLAQSIGRVAATLEEALASAAAAALEPLLGAAARALAVDGLRAAVVDLVTAGTGSRIAVTGPADLVDALRLALTAVGVDPAGLDFTVSEVAEASVVVGDSVVETRLAAWADALRRHFAPGGTPDADRAGD